MTWLQISITTNKQNIEPAENVLLAQGAYTVTLKDAADEPILEPEPGTTPMWQHAIVTGLFEGTANREQIISDINTRLSEVEHTTEAEFLQDQEWDRAWMANFQPMQFGARLWVCPWHLDPPDPSAINLRLDPGLAFGTGTHPTTALCLRWLEKHAQQQKKLLDYGCGSGILAIAALLLGIEHVDGVDIDPQALEASESNAKANKVADQLNLFTVKQFKPQKYNVVMANILSGPLIKLAATFADYTEANGHIVLSGILGEQADEVASAYSEYFIMDAPLHEEDWVMLHGLRKTREPLNKSD
jgi:ribosomal protein L11 methyltransferase